MNTSLFRTIENEVFVFSEAIANKYVCIKILKWSSIKRIRRSKRICSLISKRIKLIRILRERLNWRTEDNMITEGSENGVGHI